MEWCWNMKGTQKVPLVHSRYSRGFIYIYIYLWWSVKYIHFFKQVGKVSAFYTHNWTKSWVVGIDKMVQALLTQEMTQVRIWEIPVVCKDFILFCFVLFSITKVVRHQRRCGNSLFGDFQVYLARALMNPIQFPGFSRETALWSTR